MDNSASTAHVQALTYAGAELLIALNFSHDPRKLPFDATAALLISSAWLEWEDSNSQMSL
jgi:hypothetical protein